MILATFILAMSLPAAEEINRLTAEEQAAGWRLLFDGASARGWLEVTGAAVQAASWTVDDGCLKALRNPDGEQDIRTVESFRNFELQFDWKLLKGGNSGVKYLVQRTDRWQKAGRKGYEARARGLEYQLVDDAGSRRQGCHPHHRRARIPACRRGGPPAAARRVQSSRIVVRGEHVEHWLNGVRVLQFTLSQPEAVQVLRNNLRADGPFLRESPICLQNHTPPVWFRNMKIRRLE